MKKAKECRVGTVVLLSAAISALTTATVLVLHALLSHSGCDALCEGEDDTCGCGESCGNPADGAASEPTE